MGKQWSLLVILQALFISQHSSTRPPPYTHTHTHTRTHTHTHTHTHTNKMRGVPTGVVLPDNAPRCTCASSTSQAPVPCVCSGVSNIIGKDGQARRTMQHLDQSIQGREAFTSSGFFPLKWMLVCTLMAGAMQVWLCKKLLLYIAPAIKIDNCCCSP